jgi:5-methyltetrahydrofolate--homocysteine methyltransferase
MTSRLLDALNTRTLLGDGAMGTQLQAAGLQPGECGELWNVEHPDKVLAIQRQYVDAGSDCLITNTFGGCGLMLERHGLADQVAEINTAAARLAREAFGTREGFVLGDIGPFGGFMEPYGDVSPDAVHQTFFEQARALVAGGVDAIIIETQTSLEELGLAVEAAREAGAPCIIGSLAYDVSPNVSEMRTMMGVDPEQAARFMADTGVDILAVNCGTGVDMSWAARAVGAYRQVCNRPTMAQPNAGAPELVGAQVVYRQTPAAMADLLPEMLAAGANIIGACCGSTPEHIRALRARLDSMR